MSTTRNSELYVSWDTAKRLRFLADVESMTCGDELAESVLIDWMKAKYPDLDATMDKAERARRKVLDEAREELKRGKAHYTNPAS